jgi:hypothetical protein
LAKQIRIFTNILYEPATLIFIVKRFLLTILSIFQDEKRSAQIWQWIYFSLNEVQPNVYAWVLPALGLQKASPEPGA